MLLDVLPAGTPAEVPLFCYKHCAVYLLACDQLSFRKRETAELLDTVWVGSTSLPMCARAIKAEKQGERSCE